MSEFNETRKFGKQIQRQQLDLPEYAASFLNYKALKKVGQTIQLSKDFPLIFSCSSSSNSVPLLPFPRRVVPQQPTHKPRLERIKRFSSFDW
jgi:hypothetical protein